MLTKAKSTLLIAGISMLSLLPTKAQDKTELKFGFDKKGFKKALKDTKFAKSSGSIGCYSIWNTAFAEYLAADTAMLSAITKELVSANESLLKQNTKIGDTLRFVSSKPELIKITKKVGNAYDGNIFETPVTKDNKDLIAQIKKIAILDYRYGPVRFESYHSAILDRDVVGEQMTGIINQAKNLLSKKLSFISINQKQQEIMQMYNQKNRKEK